MSSNCTGEIMVNLRPSLAGLSRPVLIEVVYLSARFLTHGLSAKVFWRQMEADSKTIHRETSVPLVLSLMSAIEQAEGAEVANLPMSVRAAYVSELDGAMWDEVTPSIDSETASQTLALLRSTR